MHHTFTILTWIYYIPNGANECVLFEKSKGAADDTEANNNLFDFRIDSDGKISANLFYNASNLFDSGSGSLVATNNGVLTTSTWTQVGVSFEFTGTGTTIIFYKEDSSVSSVTKDDLYLEDKSSYSETFLMMSARKQSDGSYDSYYSFRGFMYSFKYFVTLPSGAENHVSDGRSTSCTGDESCVDCPRNSRGVSYDQDVCLYTGDIDEYYDTTTSDYKDCVSCVDDGCVRAEDCNKCYDRQCSTCVNFDQGQCSSCIAHANGTDDVANGYCQCDSNYYFNEAIDACEQCDSFC